MSVLSGQLPSIGTSCTNGCSIATCTRVQIVYMYGKKEAGFQHCNVVNGEAATAHDKCLARWSEPENTKIRQHEDAVCVSGLADLHYH